jgi:hypothetical protein
MRDPSTHIDPDPDVEGAIEEIRRFLEQCVTHEQWQADTDGYSSDMIAAFWEIESSNLPDWAKALAQRAVHEQTKKRRSKPTRRWRDTVLGMAANSPILRRYQRSRNDETYDAPSRASIIYEALRRLGKLDKLNEKRITAIVLEHCRN